MLCEVFIFNVFCLHASISEYFLTNEPVNIDNTILKLCLINQNCKYNYM